jgi:hypothetical protein
MRFSSRLSCAVKSALVTVVLVAGNPVMAMFQIDALGGIYSLSAKNEDGSGSVSGLGSGTVIFGLEVSPKIEVNLGYSLFFAQVITGDMGFGPDIGLNYFPVSGSRPLRVSTDQISLDITESLRPFVSVSFHQRQFQSIDTAYAGFSLGGGAEIPFSAGFDLKGLIRYITLSGPAGATATHVDILGGASFRF